jgi:hypothetical protein
MKTVTLTVLPDGTMVRTARAHVERGIGHQPKELQRRRAWDTTHLSAHLDILSAPRIAWTPEEALSNHAAMVAEAKGEVR